MVIAMASPPAHVIFTPMLPRADVVATWRRRPARARCAPMKAKLRGYGRWYVEIRQKRTRIIPGHSGGI